MEAHERRREKVRRQLASEGLEALLVTNPWNVTYLTGFTGESTWLLVSASRTLLLSDGRFTAQLAEECPELEVHLRPPGRTLPAVAGEVVRALGDRAVGFESGHLTVAEWETLRQTAPEVNWCGGRDRIERLRAVKDEEELERMRAALRLAEAAFARWQEQLHAGQTEKDLYDLLEMEIRRQGGWGSSFPPIVALGARAALPHAPPSRSRTLGDADLLLVDWGANERLYQSDLTRVLFRHTKEPSTSRRAAPPWETLYRLVQRAQEAARQVLRPGVSAAAVDAAARAVIHEAGYGEYFTHGLGHGLGLQIHELPFLRPGNEMLLEAGMVVTLEPGIYLPGQGGIRLEDEVLLTPQGNEVLSRLPHDPTWPAGATS
jgi:Xaa-Pro aminopeptidase